MRYLLAAFLLVAPASALLATRGGAPPPPPLTWQSTWISPAQAVWGDEWVLPPGMPKVLSDATLRQSVRTSLGGEQMRLVFSNEYGRTPLQLGAASVRRIGGANALAVRFQGRDGTLVAPGARIVSDPVLLRTRAGDRLEVDIFLPAPANLSGFHWAALEQTLLLQGNAIRRRDAPLLNTFTSRAFLAELQVAATRPPATVVALGDSITDGNGSTPGQDQRWPDHLSRRLAPLGVAVLNAGIAGNRLLRDGWGDSALSRFRRDVLDHPGVRAVIVQLGTNDIGHPGSPFAPDEAPASLAELKHGLRILAEEAHARGVRVIAGTVPPFRCALRGTSLEGHYSPAKDAMREALNQWIRSVGVFDGVADFDAVLRDRVDPASLDPGMDSGDHLHPGDVGYRRMAEAIDLHTLLGTSAAGQP